MAQSLDHLLENNLNWSNSVKEKTPDFFSSSSKTQTPEILWIGCSDSRVPPNEIVNLPPGEIFVHRNIANVVVHTDLNSLSVIQYAVEVLKVSHVIVCGHYGCGGVNASMTDESYGLIDNWLRHIKDVNRFNSKELEQLDGEAKSNRLCELNVAEQVKNVANTSIVKNAWKTGEQLKVHGWIYGLSDGILTDLKTSLSSLDELAAINKL